MMYLEFKGNIRVENPDEFLKKVAEYFEVPVDEVSGEQIVDFINEDMSENYRVQNASEDLYQIYGLETDGWFLDGLKLDELIDYKEKNFGEIITETDSRK